MIQLTPVLYAVLEAIDGRRDHEELAVTVGDRIGKLVTPEDIRLLTETKLRPLGVLRQPDGSEPRAKKANPLLAIGLRAAVANPKVTRLMAAPFTALFRPPVVLAFLVAFVASSGWLFFDKGLAAPMHHALYEPGLLLLVFGLTALSAGFHELGHAAACRYGGATPGSMGIGLYLVWPAFYTDVTDAYRLDRRGRLRVDFGGIYFNAVFAVATFGLWAATRWDALLVVIPLQALQMLRQLVPLVRLDGYHILADLTGVPDLFAHIKPILLGMLPSRWGSAENKVLRPRVRVVVTAWVLLVVPVLATTLFVIVMTLPRVAATAWDSLGVQWDALRDNWATGDLNGAGVRVLSILALSLPVPSMIYLLTRVIRRTARRVWRATTDRPVMRGVAILVATSLLAMVVAAWWPDGQYRPIQPDERGRVVDVSIPKGLPLAEGAVSVLGYELPRAVLSTLGGQLPPHAGLVSGALTETRNSGGTLGADDVAATPSGSAPAESDSSDFPFELPPAPRPGDNQALAVNTEDSSLVTAFAYSLVLAAGDLVDQSNEAYALASCKQCVTVAIAFQVLLLFDSPDVVIPENIAVAVNALCVECFTYALAIQLIVSAPDDPTPQQMEQLALIWGKLDELAENVESIPLDQLFSELMTIQTEILDLFAPEAEAASADQEVDVVGDTSDPDLDPSLTPTSSPSPTTTSEPSPTPTSEPSPTPTSSPSPSPTPTSEASPPPTTTP